MSNNLANEDVGEVTSVFQSTLPLREKLDKARTELLDLSARNRLLNMPRSSKGVRTLEIVDEKSMEVFRLLVRESRPFTFVPGKAADGSEQAEEQEVEEIIDLAQPDDDAVDDRGVYVRHSDTRLQTRLTPKGLQKRLLELYFDARTLEEEQGVNILYLTLGAMKWIDPQNVANVRFAPLVLIPVSLERGSAGEKFRLKARLEDFASNLSLEAYLDRVHSIRLPLFEASDGFDPTSYFAEVADAISAKNGWQVIPDDMVVGFFSFAKFLMYRDLDPDNWPISEKITDRKFVKGLLADGFTDGDDMIPEEANIDPFIPPSEMLHIVDSDSSQSLAIHEVRRGKNLVIQGPPGTGKSQTIANVIASAVADGKTVLFVAEKMAALEVVKRRLDATGVGDACLELHSNKANKRALLEELRRTWELGAPRKQDPGTLYTRLTASRDKLNAHVTRMHTRHKGSDLTPFEVVGQLSRLRLDGEKPSDIELDHPSVWSSDEFSERYGVISDLVDRIEAIGRPDDHAWRGVGLSAILPTDVERLIRRIEDLIRRFEAYDENQARLATLLETTKPTNLESLSVLIEVSKRVAGAPLLSAVALADAAWRDCINEIDDLLAMGRKHAALQNELRPVIREEAWEANLTEPISALSLLPSGFMPEAFARLSQLAVGLPKLLSELGALTRTIGCDVPTTLAEAEMLARVGDRVGAAPESSPEAFAADLWDTSVERAGDLASNVVALEMARERIGDGLAEIAWSMDLTEARTILASYGSGFFRFASGEWRRSNRLVKSVLTRTEVSLSEIIALLDALATGQAAKQKIERDDDFGRRAFGSDWLGDRSASAPLRALVEWMRSLRGLGAQPRLIASRRPPKTEIKSRAERITEIVAELLPVAALLWDDLLDNRSSAFGDAADAQLSSLTMLLTFSARLHEADVLSSKIMLDTDTSLKARRELLDAVVTGQQIAARIGEADALGKSVFGNIWKGINSTWGDLTSAARWVGANADIRMLASCINDRQQPERDVTALVEARDVLISELNWLFDYLKLDRLYALGASDEAKLQIADLRSRLVIWAASGERLFQWVAYRDRAEKGRILGCSDVVERLADGRLPHGGALAAFEMAYYEAVYADQIRNDHELGTFDGILHGRLAREFAEMDRQRILSASFEVARAHHKLIPPRDGNAVGPLGVLRSEIVRKRGHMPIRKLMEKSGPAVQALKPVFMMSPLSVAQFLVPGIFDFDLLVMDEASQIQPVDALGAVARAKQVVVVGDPKQLPPTAFFTKMTNGGAADEDDDNGSRVADIESILGLFAARGLPMRMLRWHYRSKHQSLIAVSNRQFYENKLFIVPSPYTVEAGMGLRFHHIPQGIWDAGGTRTNLIEAKVVAQAIVTHARENAHLSLGVATFSVAQRRAILDQLELMRRTLPPEIEAFFQAHPSEPFFIKNLENVQGDERDVIFISVGYGPIVPGGRVPMRFGPLGSEGGERRLNVLISRAKQRCEVFASMTDEDIDPDFAATRKGVFAFKLFMHFARTGRMTMAESTGRDSDSAFEEQVARSLQARGYQVHRQVGLAGFFIDLAVADSERPGRYLLGIECDGASYHNARSARDRDRLRQSVLESHGWVIHRIWSTDWFQRPSDQLELVISRIESAKAEYDAEIASKKVTRAVPGEIVTLERELVTEINLVAADEESASHPYTEATIQRPGHLSCELHEAPRGILSSLAESVVEIEGPVHLDEVINRIRDAWGLKRAGGRIQDAIKLAVQVAVKAGRLIEDGGFFSIPGRTPKVRDRSQVQSPALRRSDMLPPVELELAIMKVVRANFGATEEQICTVASRMLGFKSTSSQLRESIVDAVVRSTTKEWLVRKDDMLVVGPQAPAEHVLLKPISSLATLISEGEHEGLEFKETLRWDVIVKQENKKLEDVVVKTLAGFANRVGGTLLIGVADNGEAKGLDRDYVCLGGNRDKFELHLTNLFTKHFGQAYRASKIRISFPEHQNMCICRVDMDRSSQPLFITLADRGGNMAERFFVRSGNSTQELPLSQSTTYIREHF